MWDLIVSVPDHCLSFYFPIVNARLLRGKVVKLRALYKIESLKVKCS